MEKVEINSERWVDLKDLDGEIWRVVEDSKENGTFLISNYGRLKRMPFFGGRYHFPEMILKVHPSRENGYYKCRIGNKKYPIHRLVALAFLPRIPGRNHVDHINCDKSDNRACNLRWASAKMNANNPITIWNRTHERALNELDKPIPQMSTIDTKYYNPKICVSKDKFDARMGKRAQKLLEETVLRESTGCLFPPDF